MFVLQHKDPGFTGVAYGVTFRHGLAQTPDRAYATRLMKLGFRMREVPEAPEELPQARVAKVAKPDVKAPQKEEE